jgi:ElaB/YqjD/DUF883 family membrane-anchored ribosome-binding protein
MSNGKVAKIVPPSTEKMLRAKDQLASDLNALVSDAEELLASTAEYSGESLAGARSKFKGTLAQFKDRVSDAQSSAIEGFDRTVAMSEEYVRANPWKVVGAAAVVGAVLSALLLNNRR